MKNRLQLVAMAMESKCIYTCCNMYYTLELGDSAIFYYPDSDTVCSRYYDIKR